MIRVQTRQTSQPGEYIPDKFWTITEDTGIIPGTVGVGLPISTITALASLPTSPPECAVDGNLDTAWINDAPAWIQLDLGQKCTVSSLDVQFYKSAERSYNFDVDISLDKGKFTRIMSGISTQGSRLWENIPIEKNCQVIKVSINSNSSNGKESLPAISAISEVIVKGAPMTPPPTSTGVQAIISQPAQVVSAGEKVVLDGSNSKGDITAFSWDEVNGPAVFLSAVSTAIASFMAPAEIKPFPMTFALRVTDKSGQTSTAKTIIHVQSIVPITAEPQKQVDLDDFNKRLAEQIAKQPLKTPPIAPTDPISKPPPDSDSE